MNGKLLSKIVFLGLAALFYQQGATGVTSSVQDEFQKLSSDLKKAMEIVSKLRAHRTDQRGKVHLAQTDFDEANGLISKYQQGYQIRNRHQIPLSVFIEEKKEASDSDAGGNLQLWYYHKTTELDLLSGVLFAILKPRSGETVFVPTLLDTLPMYSAYWSPDFLNAEYSVYRMREYYYLLGRLVRRIGEGYKDFSSKPDPFKKEVRISLIQSYEKLIMELFKGFCSCTRQVDLDFLRHELANLIAEQKSIMEAELLVKKVTLVPDAKGDINAPIKVERSLSQRGINAKSKKRRLESQYRRIGQYQDSHSFHIDKLNEIQAEYRIAILWVVAALFQQAHAGEMEIEINEETTTIVDQKELSGVLNSLLDEVNGEIWLNVQATYRTQEDFIAFLYALPNYSFKEEVMGAVQKIRSGNALKGVKAKAENFFMSFVPQKIQ